MKTNLKCDKTVLGFRKNCIGDKCAMWVVLYHQDKDGKSIGDGMCVRKANNIALCDLAGAVFRLTQTKK